MEETTTARLTEILRHADPDSLEDYLAAHARELIAEQKPFAAYMRLLLKEKKCSQQALFLAADLPERYGYKLISEEKHTRRWDVILRLCIGGRLTLDETQNALKLSGMVPLYPRIPRDAALMIAVNRAVGSAHEADAILLAHGMEPLCPCGEL